MLKVAPQRENIVRRTIKPVTRVVNPKQIGKFVNGTVTTASIVTMGAVAIPFYTAFGLGAQLLGWKQDVKVYKDTIKALVHDLPKNVLYYDIPKTGEFMTSDVGVLAKKGLKAAKNFLGKLVKK